MRYDCAEESIVFNQIIIVENSLYMDTENAEFDYNVDINGYKAFISVNENGQSVYWSDENYLYMVGWSETEDRNELIKIAESVKPR